jgi:hypothetical protein
MDYIEDDFTDALIDAVCGKLPSTWYTLIGESRKLTIRRTLKMHLMMNLM